MVPNCIYPSRAPAGASSFLSAFVNGVAVELNGRVRTMLFPAWEHAIDAWKSSSHSRHRRVIRSITRSLVRSSSSSGSTQVDSRGWEIAKTVLTPRERPDIESSLSEQRQQLHRKPKREPETEPLTGMEHEDTNTSPASRPMTKPPSSVDATGIPESLPKLATPTKRLLNL